MQPDAPPVQLLEDGVELDVLEVQKKSVILVQFKIWGDDSS